MVHSCLELITKLCGKFKYVHCMCSRINFIDWSNGWAVFMLFYFFNESYKRSNLRLSYSVMVFVGTSLVIRAYRDINISSGTGAEFRFLQIWPSETRHLYCYKSFTPYHKSTKRSSPLHLKLLLLLFFTLTAEY